VAVPVIAWAVVILTVRQVQVVLYLCLGGLPAAVLGLLALALLPAYLGLDRLNVALTYGMGRLLLLVAVAIRLTPLLSRRHHQRPDRGISRSG
jgi:hypothetical protein